MKRKIVPFIVCVLCGMWACNTQEDQSLTSKSMKVAVQVVADLKVKAVGSEDENRLNTFDLFLFDAESGLLEVIKQNIPALTPENGNVVGEQKVGEVELPLKDDKAKNVLVVGNPSSERVSYPALEVGTTTYTEMQEAVSRLDGHTPPASPFVMSGYANRVNCQDDPLVTVSLRRRIAKLSVSSLSTESFTVTSLHLKQVVNHAYLFKKGHGTTGLQYVDYDPVSASGASFYLFPPNAANNRMTLTVEGTLNGQPFSQTLDIKPKTEQGGEVEMDHNTDYTVRLSAVEGGLTMNMTIQTVEGWNDGEEIPGVIGGESTDEGWIAFNGLQWMDRNLGAVSSDLENDWEQAIGSFYQWGRNATFATSGYETVSGPLSADEAEKEENKAKFVTKMSGDWLSGSDPTRWQTAEKQPCPAGYRMPTVADFMGIFTSSGVLVNMTNPPVTVSGENLTGGSYSAQYWGNNSAKTIWGIKKYGTDAAYYMRWEYLKTTAGKAYLRISRWEADAAATFDNKTLSDIQDGFAALGDAREVLTFPGAGYITGSNGNYSDSPGGYYWSSSLGSGDVTYRAEFTDGKMRTGDESYKSRVSGHSVRCIKQ